MGRTTKPGISFYRVDAYHILNKKVRLLFNEFDSDGYYVWSCLLDYGYAKWGYYFDTNDTEELELFATEFCKKKVNLIREVISGCIRRGLFDQAVYDMSGILTCEMMQETFIHATADRRAKGSVFEMQEDWLLLDNSTDTPANIVIVPRKKKINPLIKEIDPSNNSQIRSENTTQEENQKRKKESVAPAMPPPPKKGVGKKGEEEPEPYWQALVDVWFVFGREKFGADPSFARDDPKIFKRIIGRLKQRAGAASKPWDENGATQRLRYFLDCAYADEWLCKHFLLANLEKQFDVIIQKHAAAAKKNTPGNNDLQYLYERFVEGSMDQQFITDKHFEDLVGRKLVNPDLSVLIPQRIKSLVGSNQATELRLLEAYQQHRITPESQADTAILRRMAVVNFFRHQKTKNNSDVFQA